ncbi:pyridoxal-5'-phosphate-dependent enzyme family protein [Actinidia rufa]|uniref:tryptophan synthase n=1 Tax=Actinidia rufa TaxID=165716 RepID=A0A7J0D9D9_9ERIC|nr:pyridoxal-5'-phosphate-dependent enzyme family protein [Actinidia rufa]
MKNWEANEWSSVPEANKASPSTPTPFTVIPILPLPSPARSSPPQAPSSLHLRQQRREREGAGGMPATAFGGGGVSSLVKTWVCRRQVLCEAGFESWLEIRFCHLPLDGRLRGDPLGPREDLNNGGAHKINNAIAQAMLARSMGRKRVVATAGVEQHGIATAAACAKLSLECTIFMGKLGVEGQPSNVVLMNLLGAQAQQWGPTHAHSWLGNSKPLYERKQRTGHGEMGWQARGAGGLCGNWVQCLATVPLRDEDVKLIGVDTAGAKIVGGQHSGHSG